MTRMIKGIIVYICVNRLGDNFVEQTLTLLLTL